ncbi:MAG: GFA family protein [Alphaproteobacteria bacterium]|jgi:hypothetical protein|nr:GFA family protein [Alphaproteobacteria bacterium]MBT4082652.1 GFA family protein [Alphaproteobacteria bacterium]MBT4545914.1 GFA family protein [Alphaproteobacteria bacterium]MBT6388048.1 GFA family protein [Alphaproteobacteria bacterium]MBT7746419.1 GFA family protein [Alphaproteobacteria bacterium]
MKLEGSCHCGAIHFSVETESPVPFLRCYCSICRKVGGGGGYAINLGSDFRTIELQGEEFLSRYHKVDIHPDTGEKTEAEGHRCFCSKCGTALWNYDPRWPDLVHPFASAIDTPLPKAPSISHMMLGSKANWVPVDSHEGDKKFEEYPDEPLADWHQRNGFGL